MLALTRPGRPTSSRPPVDGSTKMDVVVRVWASVPRFRRPLSGLIKGFRALAQTRTQMSIGADSLAPAHRPQWASLSEFAQASEIPQFNPMEIDGISGRLLKLGLKCPSAAGLRGPLATPDGLVCPSLGKRPEIPSNHTRFD